MRYTMEKELNFSDKENYTLSLTQLELLEELEVCDNAAYPWDTTDLASEAYFAEHEQEFLLEDFLSESEITEQSQKFFTQIEQIWSSTAFKAAFDIQANINYKFAGCIPQSWLNAIANKACHVFNSQKLTADKLVQCVQELLPNWAEDDLLVLARPYTYAMRGKETEKIESVVADLHSRNWQMLSEIEQARASLAIAHYTLTELQHKQQHQE